jgi:hypothetical protein
MSKRTLYVGDSLGVGTSPYVKGVNANVRVGRPSSEGLQIVRRQGRRYNNIVFDLGTNDGSVKDLKRSVKALRRTGKNITMATIHGPDAARKNAYLKQLASKGAIKLVNTSGVKLSGDGIHATPQGYKQRGKLMNRALQGGGASRTPRRTRGRRYSSPGGGAATALSGDLFNFDTLLALRGK